MGRYLHTDKKTKHMKKLFIILAATIYLVACKSSSSHLVTGNYDAAMQKSAKKIRKKPGNFEEVDIFNDAYRMAYAKDNDEAIRLKGVGNPANWKTIYTIYLRMKKRQDLAESLPPVGVSYEKRDFNEDINTARDNATAYAYDQGVSLLATNDRADARKAYDYFKEAQKYNSSYQDVNAQLKAAKLLGTTDVFYRVENKSEAAPSQQMMSNLQNIDLNSLDKNWKNYDSYIDTNIRYDYSIVLSLQLIEITPEQLKETAAIESKQVEDGFNYVFDANGNVTKDSLGNDVKKPKYKTISCNIQRFTQSKAIRISGVITYINNSNNQIVKKENIMANDGFTHNYAIATGDRNALKPETVNELKVKAKPFPTDNELMLQAAKTLKKTTNDFIIANQGLIK